MVQRRSRSAERAEVNRRVRMAVRRFDGPGPGDDTWDFLCECGADGCDRWVGLTVAEYERLRAADEPIVAEGHSPSRGQRARSRARGLVDDAKALSAQAELQRRRAGRNRPEDES